MQAVDVHAITCAICGLKEGKALDVIPVCVAHEQVNFKIALGIFAGESDSQFAKAGAALENHDILAALHLHASRVAAITNRLRAGCSDRPARPPELHAKYRAI